MDIRKIKLPGEMPDERMIFDLPETETVSLGYVSVATGEKTHLGLHEDEEEIYIILGGRALLRLGDEEAEVARGDSVYVPRNTLHQMTCTSPEKLEYLYIANYPDKEGRGGAF